MGDNNESYEYNYDPEPELSPKPELALSCDALCVFILTSHIIIFILGVLGNGLVIWITGLKTKRTVNSSWYLSLAVSDFLFCATLPFNTVYMTTGKWNFGHVMCKLIRVVFPLNLHSSIFLLLIISVDRCICVLFPVWTQNHRTLKRSSIIIILAWILSALLSLPTLVFSTTYTTRNKTLCINDLDSTAFSHAHMLTIGFVFGFAIPLMVIAVCYCIIMQKLRASRMVRSSKPFKVMTAVMVAFVLCFLPFQIFRFLEVFQLNSIPISLVKAGLKITTTLAYANSFMNPILYSFMGHDFRNKCFKSVLARMENAFQEEAHSTKAISMSKSEDSFVQK